MTFYDAIKKGKYTLERMAETVSWSASGTWQFKKDVPYHRDLYGILFEFTGQVDSGSAVTKVLDNMFQEIATLNVDVDGQPRITLYDYEIKWFSWFMTGIEPEIMESPDATSQSNKAVYLRFIIPCGFKKGKYNKISVYGTWGAIADADSGASFNVDSGTLSLIAILGDGVTKEYYTKQHSNTVNGDDEHTAPAGTLEGIILQTSDRSDSIDTYELEVNGYNYYKMNHEANRAVAKQFHGIDLFGEADRDAEWSLQTGLLFIDGQQLVSDGKNMKIRYKTTSSKTVYCRYIFSRIVA